MIRMLLGGAPMARGGGSRPGGGMPMRGPPPRPSRPGGLNKSGGGKPGGKFAKTAPKQESRNKSVQQKKPQPKKRTNVQEEEFEGLDEPLGYKDNGEDDVEEVSN